MPTFRKNVLSQYLRTKCDKQLRLSLYSPPELSAMSWPVPLTARPAVQILRDRGIEWEQAKMSDLENAFGTNIQANKVNGEFKEVELLPLLQQNLPSPTFILQPTFTHATLKAIFLQSIGLAAPLIQEIPNFSAFRPDIIWVQTPLDDEVEILPNGDMQTIQSGDTRKALIICDIKHAGESNSSYSSEVTLYAALLSNWLRLHNLENTYFVASRMALWTRAKEISDLAQLITNNPGATISDKTQSFWRDLESIDFPIFFQTIDHFFKSDLPRVLAIQNWSDLDWHVDSRCSNCDFLGHRDWLSHTERPTLDAHRDHYCVPNAQDIGHLSRLATITRGSRKTLNQAGYADVNAVTQLSPNAPVFDNHNALKADRNHLPHRATALSTGNFTVAPNTTTIDFPKWADLEIFITVNFDPGTGLLTALGSEARFRQRVPFGQQSQHSRVWPSEAQTLLSSTLQEERNVLTSFLSRLAEVFAHVNDTHPDRGGAMASRTQVQVYLWDHRQFEELAKAIGRHLNAIVMPQNDRYLRGLVWLFPPPQLLPEDDKTLANPITFLKTVIQRDLRLPVPHCLTMFNVVEAYHNPSYPPYIPGSFYRDPYSDMIPRERIYEIWSQEPLIRIRTLQRARSQCISDYSEAVKKQVAAIRNIVWKFREDMSGRLHFSARPLQITVPFNFQGMSEDGRLWYAWALLEEACNLVELRRTWSSEPEELEANYNTLRFEQLQAQTNDDLTYQARPTSRDCKFRDNESFLALQDESIPGFLDLRVRDLLTPPLLNTLQPKEQNAKMAAIFGATLLDFNRDQLRANVRLTTFGSAPALRQLLLSNNLVNLTTNTSLIENSGPAQAERVRECLVAIARPPIAIAAPATYEALGHAPGNNPPSNDPLTPAANVLWDAASLAVAQTNLQAHAIQTAINAIANAQWPLNQSQRNAIAHCLSRRLSIVWGPPGTGKTTTAAAMVAARILVAQAAGQSLRLLITGPTYTAWENLFDETLKLLELLHVTNIPCYRIYSSSHEEHSPLPLTSNTVTDVQASTNDPDFLTLAQSLQAPTQVLLVGTVAHQCYRIADQATGSPLASFFDVIAIDESSQLDIAKSLFPICLLADNSEISFFGDHLQMPPVITTQPPRNAEWLVGSIQNYLIRRHGCTPTNLLINYRSAEPFVTFGKRIGYPQNLTAHAPHLALHPIATPITQPANWSTNAQWFSGLLDILTPDRRLTAITYPDGRAGQANDFEADLVCSMVQHLFLTMSQQLDGQLDDNGTPITPTHAAHTEDTFWSRGLGIVTPHRAQRALIVRRLRQIFPTPQHQRIDAAVDTVERFQGGQRDTIIISFGVGDPDLIADEEGFLLQLERTNVAISRARAKCTLVISEDLAYHLPSDRETIATSKAVKSYVSDFCRQTTQLPVPVPGATPRQITLRWHQ